MQVAIRLVLHYFNGYNLRQNKYNHLRSNLFFFSLFALSSCIFLQSECRKQLPLSLFADFSMSDVRQEYLFQIKLWIESEDVEAYASHFFDVRLFRTFNMYITFDERIIEPLKDIVKSLNFIEYTPSPEHRSVAKDKLRRIIRILGENGFISVEEWNNLIFKIENYTLKNSIDKFFQAAEKMQKQKGVLPAQTVTRAWKNTINKNVEQIWGYLTEKKIIDKCIIKLIDICRPCIKQFSIIRINQIDNYYDFLQKHFNPTTQIPSTIQAFFPPSQQMNKAYNENIDRFITERSIFLNPEKRNLAYQQIRDVIATISCGNYAGGSFVYDLYGSMKTGFAIAGLSDADIHITPPTQQLLRNEKIRYLLEVCKTLTSNSLNKLNYFIQPYISETIKVPFIKMKLDKTVQSSQPKIIKSIDIIIDTRSGIENSKILAMYSQSQYILKFGNLVKFWAKKKNIINAKKPTQGLSSYGVLLMALFYLIKSKQAPYVIQSAQGYRLEKKLLGERDYKPLLDNFKDFLDFYRPNGPFFSENMIVCLKEHPTFKGHYYDKYLINMYDFVDGSNPGRLSKHSCDKFFSTITRTHALLIGRHEMHEVMRYQE